MSERLKHKAFRHFPSKSWKRRQRNKRKRGREKCIKGRISLKETLQKFSGNATNGNPDGVFFDTRGTGGEDSSRKSSVKNEIAAFFAALPRIRNSSRFWDISFMIFSWLADLNIGWNHGEVELLECTQVKSYFPPPSSHRLFQNPNQS